MRISNNIVMMFIGSFIIQYFFMNTIMVDNKRDITNSVGKFYISIIMAFYMIILETMMHDHQYKVFSTNTYIVFVFLLLVFIYFYRNQVAINDKQYLEGMIEHHSMALLTSKEIIKKTNNFNVARISKHIIEKQEDEMREMRTILEHIKLSPK